MAPLKSINFSLIWWAGSPWFSEFVFSRTSWENWSIMWSFLFPLSVVIFFPLLYHDLIYVLIIRHHSVNFFPPPLWTILCSERTVVFTILLKFYWNPCDWWEELLKNIRQCVWRWEWVARLGMQLPSPALHHTPVAGQGFNLISRRTFAEFLKKTTGPGKHSTYLV